MSRKPPVLGVTASTLFRALPYFTGAMFSGGLPRLSAVFRDRESAESDQQFKQLIPYVAVFDASDRLLCYRRKGGQESRLDAKLSIGVGGHVEPCDVSVGSPAACASDASAPAYWHLSSVLRRAAIREIVEEIDIGGPSDILSLDLLGFVNDDSDPVGSVHFGIVYRASLSVVGPGMRAEAGGEVHSYVPARQSLRSPMFESWSRHVVELLCCSTYNRPRGRRVCEVCNCVSESLTLMDLQGLGPSGPGDSLLTVRPADQIHRAVCLICQDVMRRRLQLDTISTLEPISEGGNDSANPSA